jgi:hypothetical protein
MRRTRRAVRGEETVQVAGCVGGLIGLGMLIAMFVIGGVWRTEVTFSRGPQGPPGSTTKFEENLGAQHWLFGLIQGKQPNLEEALRERVGPGDVLTRISIMTRHTAVDYLVTAFTAGIYAPVTVTIKGEVARGGMPQLPDAGGAAPGESGMPSPQGGRAGGMPGS